MSTTGPKSEHAIRWRFQFGIRSLLVLTAAVAVACSWLAVNLQRAKKQKAAVEAIRALDGSVEYDWRPDDPNDPFSGGNADSSAADSLRRRVRTCVCRLFGQDFVSDAVSVDMNDGRRLVLQALRAFASDAVPVEMQDRQSGTHATICDADLVHLRESEA